jgi:proteasome assembly chaperone 1
MTELWTDCDVFSRAVDDDDDDDDDSKSDSDHLRSPQSVFVMSDKIKDVQCEALIIAVGLETSEYVEHYIITAESADIVGTVTTDQIECCHVWRLHSHPDTLIAVCPTDVKPHHTFSITQQLLSAVCTPKSCIYIVMALSVANYRSASTPGDLPSCFVRTLSTSASRLEARHPTLEQPNIVTGLAAQVVSYCEVHLMQCLLSICFADAVACKSDVMNVCQKIFQSTPLHNLPMDKKLKFDMQQTVSLYFNSSILYT